jgi:rhodanese-related sulfurtransferase
MSSATLITTEQLDLRLQQGGAFQFWNVLTDEYFKEEMIGGSLRVPLETVGREASRLGLPKTAEIVVYCASKSCPFSGQAAEKLRTLGYTNVRAYEGGLEEWKESGRPIVRLAAASVAA